MKILLALHQFFPDFAAGTELLAWDTARELRARGDEVSIVTGFPVRHAISDADRFDRYEYDGFPVYRFSHWTRPMGGQCNVMEAEYDNRLFAGWFREHLTQSRPDIVHFFHLQRLSATAIGVCADLGIPTVLTPTDFWALCPTIQLLLPDGRICRGPDGDGVNCLKHLAAMTSSRPVAALVNRIPDRLLAALACQSRRKYLSRVPAAGQVRALLDRPGFILKRLNMLDRLLVPTRLLERMLADWGVAPDRMTYCPFGVKPASVRRETRSRAGGVLKVGFIGTLVEHKGCHVLIEAVRALVPAARVTLEIFGSPEHYPEYARTLRRLAGDDPRIAFRGTFPGEVIGDVLSGLDLLVVPSIWHENTPLVVYFAQAAGCPVVASDVGGIAEVIVHGQNGLLFPPADVAALSSLLARLADDGALLEELSSRAVSPRPFDAYLEDLLDAYRQVVAARRPGEGAAS